MRVIIIPADKTVIVDGEVRAPLEFAMDPAIHAVQWYDDYGEVEFVTGADRIKPPNQFITDLAPYQNVLDAWAAWVPPEPQNVDQT